MKLLVRGASWSRQVIMCSRKRFNRPITLITNECAPNALHADKLAGLTPNLDLIYAHIDPLASATSEDANYFSPMLLRLPRFLRNTVEPAGASLHDLLARGRGSSPRRQLSWRLHFERQFERNVLDATGAALLVLDPWSEMRYPLYRHRKDGWRFWVPHQVILNMRDFLHHFDYIGHCTPAEALIDMTAVIEAVRRNNPEIPVLFLPCPREGLPKNVDHEAMNLLGIELSRRFRSSFIGTSPSISDSTCVSPEEFGQIRREALRYPIEQGLLDVVHALDSRIVNADAITALEKRLDAKIFTVSVMTGADCCVGTCPTHVSPVLHKLQPYFLYEGESIQRTKELRYRCSVIDLSKYKAYADFESEVKKSGKGNRIRLHRKAIALGYYCKPFPWRLHIPDVHAVNTSTPIRSGEPLTGSAARTIGELGGAPQKALRLDVPKCKLHWNYSWGVFRAEPGHLQGAVEVGERLFGYIFLKRFGELIMYSLIMGHHDCLADGVMVQLHHEVMKWIIEGGDGLCEGVTCVMYGGHDQGLQGLQDWKRREAFEPRLVNIISH